MTDDPDIFFLFLKRVTMYGSPPHPSMKSIPVTTNCGHKGWMAPSSRRWLAGEGAGAYVLCTNCGTTYVDSDEEGILARSVPGSREEFEQHFGPGFERQFAKFIKSKGL